jgi:hypothetical protein
MGKFAQGQFVPKNPAKYVGINKPRYRSSWELAFMIALDSNKKVVKWASESIQIPYRNPLTGKNTIYVPDFLVVYERAGNLITELVEIKPKKQTLMEEKVRNARDRAAIAVNQAKWKQANLWCKKYGITFRVLTEDQLFYNGRS